jgi:hypothetical protein
MATFKDILYKKEDDETWSEWSKRVPDNDEDKLDYIGETIYVKIYDDDKENTLEITDILLQLGIDDLIPLLENEELLDAKIEQAYKVKYEAENTPKCHEKYETENTPKCHEKYEEIRRNVYIILAHDDCGGKEELYGCSNDFEEAQIIAREAVRTGEKRKNKDVECKTDCIVGEKVEALYTQNGKWYGATISKVNKIWRKGEQITQIDVIWDDNQKTYDLELELGQIRKIKKYNRFDSARIIDLDTQAEVEEFGVYVSDEVFGYP